MLQDRTCRCQLRSCRSAMLRFAMRHSVPLGGQPPKGSRHQAPWVRRRVQQQEAGVPECSQRTSGGDIVVFEHRGTCGCRRYGCVARYQETTNVEIEKGPQLVVAVVSIPLSNWSPLPFARVITPIRHRKRHTCYQELVSVRNLSAGRTGSHLSPQLIDGLSESGKAMMNHASTGRLGLGKLAHPGTKCESLGTDYRHRSNLKSSDESLITRRAVTTLSHLERSASESNCNLLGCCRHLLLNLGKWCSEGISCNSSRVILAGNSFYRI